MLIGALCDYYDVIAGKGVLVPEGYSNVNVSFLVSLNEDGGVDDITDWSEDGTISDKNGKISFTRSVVMPRRTEKPGIDANVIEHRFTYLFGLNFADGRLDPSDSTDKAKKSHKAFAERNLEFLEGLDSPVVNAYRNFILNWIPEEQVLNPYILSCGKKCKSGYFAFCLSGHPELLLHDDSQVNAKWKKKFNETEEGNGKRQTQCCITGRPAEIARTHNKIKGLPKSGTGGNTLVCFNCPAESSYGYDQSYNSNISEDAMYKYTAAMNYLLANKKHKTVIDDVAVIHWASSGDNKCDDLFSMVFGDASDADATDEALCSVMKKM